MTPRPGPVLATLALLIAAPLLAGCVGTAAATAMETRSQADEAARRWDAGAQLAQVAGVEGTFDLAALAAYAAGAGGGNVSSDHAAASGDKEVGDGRAEVWAYRYVASGKKMAYVVVVDREGNILREGEETRGSDLNTPIGEWTIDSDRALAIAKEGNDALRQGLEAEQFGILSLLRHDPHQANPTWLVAGGGGSFAGAGGGMVEIDAVTGKVLKSEGRYMTPEDFQGQWQG